MIAENVIFVSDIDGRIFFIPLEHKDMWEMWCYEEEGLDGFEGNPPDWATLVEGETYVVNVIRKL